MPVGITHGIRVAVVITILDGGDRPPGDVVVLRVPSGDTGIGNGQTGKWEKSSAVLDVVKVGGRDVPRGFVPCHEKVGVIESGQVSLVLGSRAVRKRAERFDLVESLRVAAAG